MRPAHIRFGQGKTQDESDLNQISYRKAQISVYTKGAGNRKISNAGTFNYKAVPAQATTANTTQNNSMYGLNASANSSTVVRVEE